MSLRISESADDEAVVTFVGSSLDVGALIDRRTSARADGEDRRRTARRRVLLTVVVVSEDFEASFRASMRDIAEGGARLTVPTGQFVPVRFWLISVTAGVAFEATTVWRDYPAVGLALGPPLDLAEPTNQAARRLNPFWQAAVS